VNPCSILRGIVSIGNKSVVEEGIGNVVETQAVKVEEMVQTDLMSQLKLTTT